MKSRSNVICAKLAYMNSLALSVGASNTKLVESMVRAYRDIGIEHIFSTELMMAKVKEVKNNVTSDTTGSHWT